MHRLSPHIVGASLGITVGILYILCALAYAFAPTITTDLFVYMFHGVNVKSLLTPMEFWPTVTGLVVTFVYTYIAGALFAFIWNAFAPSSENK